ncbi:MAG: phage integrase SAM-like domain-containing protein [Chitinophagaceae bacterium]|nr:phage integrase SAM-like domain-containing protein [Chitinophagaceae bacterium]
MGEVKFVLKEPKIKDDTLVYLFYRFSNQTLKYSTGIKIRPRFWNPDSQKARQSRLFTQSESINETLENLSTTLKNAHRDLVNAKKTPTPYKLKEELNKALFKEEYAQKQGFLKFVEELIEHSNRMKNTKKQWQQTLRKLVEFKRATQKEVDFDTIDLEFYNSFVNFLTKEGYTKNTIGGFIKNVKIFMNEAVDRKLTNNLEYRNRKFRVMEEKVDKIYLSQYELKSIYDLDLSKTKAGKSKRLIYSRLLYRIKIFGFNSGKT